MFEKNSRSLRMPVDTPLRHGLPIVFKVSTFMRGVFVILTKSPKGEALNNG